MTSTITAEERARALWEAVDNPTLVSGECVGLIFSAIRQAEDAAYERAAVILLTRSFFIAGKATPNVLKDIVETVSEIRSLKSPSPPKDQGHE